MTFKRLEAYIPIHPVFHRTLTFGELNAACSMALSSVPRRKTHSKGRPVVREPDESKQEAEIRTENKVLL